MIKKPLLKTVVAQSAIAASLVLSALTLSPATFADEPEHGTKQQRFICTINHDDKQFTCERQDFVEAKENAAKAEEQKPSDESEVKPNKPLNAYNCVCKQKPGDEHAAPNLSNYNCGCTKQAAPVEEPSSNA